MSIKKIIFSVFLIPCFVLTTLAADDFSLHQAKKIDFFLKKIAKAKKSKVFFRKGTFSEDELNSYLNMIYTKKFAPEVKYVKLQLKKENRVSGTMKVKLVGKRYKGVPDFLKDFELTFSGTVESANARMRYLFDELKINGTSFSPEVLDEALGTAQAGMKVKSSLFDWFNFLPGIKKIAVTYNQITFYY